VAVRWLATRASRSEIGPQRGGPPFSTVYEAGAGIGDAHNCSWRMQLLPGVQGDGPFFTVRITVRGSCPGDAPRVA